MDKIRFFGVLCIFAIALASTIANSNDPLASNLLNAIFIISWGVTGVWLLRKINLCETLVARNKGSRRSDLPVKFPLTDSRKVILIRDRRRLLDRRTIMNGLDYQESLPRKMGGN